VNVKTRPSNAISGHIEQIPGSVKVFGSLAFTRWPSSLTLLAKENSMKSSKKEPSTCCSCSSLSGAMGPRVSAVHGIADDLTEEESGFRGERAGAREGEIWILDFEL
jgi:hypothetical protein